MVGLFLVDLLFDEETDILLHERRGVCFRDVIRTVEQNGNAAPGGRPISGSADICR